MNAHAHRPITQSLSCPARPEEATSAGISSRDAFGGTDKPINNLNDKRNQRSAHSGLSESVTVTWSANTNNTKIQYICSTQYQY